MTKSKKVLIVGENSYLASNLQFDAKFFSVNKIRRPFDKSEQYKYKDYDYIINFCIQPEHFTRILEESEMIDVQIARAIAGTNTKQVFLSSRKVYGSNFELKEYKETDELKPYDFYSKNKVAIEQKLQEINPENTLILRTGNIIGKPAAKRNYKTFIGWIEKELEEKGKVCCTILPETKKDFITRDYFQEILNISIQNNLTGIYNVGAGFTLPIHEILDNIFPKNIIDYSNAITKSEQFILNNNKIKTFARTFTKEELLEKCIGIKKHVFKGEFISEKMVSQTKDEYCSKIDGGNKI